jgi:hypothetical protein
MIEGDVSSPCGYESELLSVNLKENEQQYKCSVTLLIRNSKVRMSYWI